MSVDFPFRTPTFGPSGDLYNTKLLWSALDSLVPENKGWVDTEPNQLRTTILKIAAAMLSGMDHASLRNMIAETATLSPAGGAKLLAIAGRLWMSEDGQALDTPTRPPEMRTLRYFGCRMDSNSDPSIALNNAAIADANEWAFDLVSNQHRPAAIIIPNGDLAIASTFLIQGTQGGIPSLLTEHDGAPPFNLAQSRIRWYGASNQTVVFLEQANEMLIRGITIDGRSIAGCGLHVAAHQYGVGPPDVLKAADAIRIEKCRIGFVKIQVDGNAAVKIGTNPADTPGGIDTWEAADVTFRETYFLGEDPGAAGFDYALIKASGVRMLSPGNCKNFEFHRCDWLWCDNALDARTLSGYCLVTGFGAGDCRTVFRQGGGQMIVLGGDAEAGHVDQARLLLQDQFSTTQIWNSEFFANMGASNPKAFEAAGLLGLYYVTMAHQPIGDSMYRPFIGTHSQLPSSISTGGMLEVVGCTFVACGSKAHRYPPIQDGSNDVTPGSSLSYARGAAVRLYARGNFGSYSDFGEGATPSWLYDIHGPPLHLPNLMPYQNAYGFHNAAAPPNYEGNLVEACYSQTFDFNDVKTAAGGGSAVTLSLIQGVGTQGFRAVDLFVQIITPFAGRAMTLKANHLDDGATTMLQLLDITQAANTWLGVTDAERGDVFQPGNPLYNSKGMHWAESAANGIYLRFTGDGALSALSAGKITVYLVAQFFKQGNF